MKSINHSSKSTKICYYPCYTSNSILKPYFPITIGSTPESQNQCQNINHTNISLQQEKWLTSFAFQT
ncbi:hypothetical protein IMY05_018G0102200 [Salix suchowensis]|nr:hypothetical protein IMY05_018G0102200 [Salix suchowensis]